MSEVSNSPNQFLAYSQWTCLSFKAAVIIMSSLSSSPAVSPCGPAQTILIFRCRELIHTRRFAPHDTTTNDSHVPLGLAEKESC